MAKDEVVRMSTPELIWGRQRAGRAKWKWLALLAGVALLASMIGGHQRGVRAGQGALERLRLVWPAFESLPERDRALLAGLSWSCRLSEGPKLRDDTIACLR